MRDEEALRLNFKRVSTKLSSVCAVLIICTFRQIHRTLTRRELGGGGGGLVIKPVPKCV